MNSEKENLESIDNKNNKAKPRKISLSKYSIILFSSLIFLLLVDDYFGIVGEHLYIMVYTFFCFLGIIISLIISNSSNIIRDIIGIAIILIFIPTLVYINYINAVAEVNSSFTSKPIIYLYPEEETSIHVTLGNPELLTCTYPKYDENKGWNVVAEPNGDLKYEDKDLYALYWEGNSKNKKEIKDDGFIVKGEDTAKFLEEKLSVLGLTDREAEEFIVYWLPRMEKNNYNYIRFETMDEIEYNMPLDITPKPDTTIRVVMDWCEIKDEREAENLKKNIKEQILTKVERKGYVVVEWGGSEI